MKYLVRNFIAELGCKCKRSSIYRNHFRGRSSPENQAFHEPQHHFLNQKALPLRKSASSSGELTANSLNNGNFFPHFSHPKGSGYEKRRPSPSIYISFTRAPCKSNINKLNSEIHRDLHTSIITTTAENRYQQSKTSRSKRSQPWL